MQKYLKLLEKHVQWIALGFAALFLGDMVWSYLVNPPIQVKLSPSKIVTPGSVNEAIVAGPVGKLQTEIQQPNEEFSIAVPDLLAPWLGAVAGPATPPGPLQTLIAWDPAGTGPVGPGHQDRTVQAQVKALPKLPPATPLAINTLRTTIERPNPKAAPAAGGAAAAIISENKDVVSMTFSVDMKTLTAAFDAAFGAGIAPAAAPAANNNAGAAPINPAAPAAGNAIQNALLKTVFLQVVVRREEQSGGSWINSVVVPPLVIHAMEPYPGDNAKSSTGYAYEDWATKHVDEILHPAFYTVAAGAAPWTMPGSDAPTPTHVDAPRAPAAPAAPRAPGPPAAPRPPAAAPRRTSYAPPSDAQRSWQLAVAQPVAPAPAMAYVIADVGGRAPRPAPFTGAQGGVIMFNPASPGPDIEILAHDDTVEPGKTYRYTVQYKLRNPIYQSNVPVTDQKWYDVFALVSPVSPATNNVTIPDRSELFVRSIQKNEVHFDVFTWDGTEKVRDVPAQPGDTVAGTNWVVVDIRTDPHARDQLYVLLADNNNGTLQRRDFKTDQGDPRYKARQDDVKNAPQARAN